MEKQVQVVAEGDEVQLNDINRMGEAAGLADDRVFAELLRMTPFGTTQKAVLPYGVSGWAKLTGLTSTALVQGNTADGKVRVMPFRAFISSLDNSTNLERMRGIRSTVFVGSGSGLIYEEIAITASITSDPRWVLIYAAVTPNANGVTEDRYNKDPVTEAETTNGRVTYKRTTVTVTSLNGAEAATPTRPALPADAAGTYYIALAYIWVPGLFGASGTILRQYIHEVAPTIGLHTATGAMSLAPANQQYAKDGTVDTNQLDATQEYRPGAFLPATMVGGEARIIPLQLGLTPLSHLDAQVVDSSVDWRFRFFKWTVYVRGGSATANAIASDRQASGANLCPSAIFTGEGSSMFTGMGQSFANDTALGVAWAPAPVNPVGAALYITEVSVSNLGGAGSFVMMFVNTSGHLVLKYTGPVLSQILVWIEATAPYSNFGIV